MTTATITFIEAIRTKDPRIRNILNLETCISVVAAFIKFVTDMKEINYEEINVTLCRLVYYNTYYVVHISIFI